MAGMNEAVDPNPEDDIRATFLAAEHEGIRLAIKGRFVAIAFIALLYVFTRSAYVFDILFAAALLLGLGFLHFRLVGSRYDRPWVKFVFITIDIVLLSVAIASTREVAVHDLPPARPGIRPGRGDPAAAAAARRVRLLGVPRRRPVRRADPQRAL